MLNFLQMMRHFCQLPMVLQHHHYRLTIVLSCRFWALKTLHSASQHILSNFNTCITCSKYEHSIYTPYAAFYLIFTLFLLISTKIWLPSFTENNRNDKFLAAFIWLQPLQERFSQCYKTAHENQRFQYK